MKLSEVLIKPILTEKANGQQDKLRRYAFKVAHKANKLEIKKAVEEFYGVNVVDVNTAVVPGKNKTRYTKKGFVKGPCGYVFLKLFRGSAILCMREKRRKQQNQNWACQRTSPLPSQETR